MKFRFSMQDFAASALQVGGVTGFAEGLSRIYSPLGWIVGGAFLALVGWAMTPAKSERRPEHR